MPSETDGWLPGVSIATGGLFLVIGSAKIAMDPKLGWWVLDVDPGPGYAGIIAPPAIAMPIGLLAVFVGWGLMRDG